MIVKPLSKIRNSIQNSEKVAHESNKWGDQHCKNAYDISCFLCKFFYYFIFYLTSKHTHPQLEIHIVLNGKMHGLLTMPKTKSPPTYDANI